MRESIKRGGSFLFLLPAAIFVLMAELVPVIYTTYLGFMEWNLIQPPKWAGLANYLNVFSTPELLNALKNTAYWVVGTLVFAVGFPLLIAALLTRVKGKAIFKTIFFIPSTLSPTIAAIFWRRVLSSQQGALYRESFLLFRMGLGSAIAVVLSIITLLASYRYLAAMGGRKKKER